MASSSNIVTRSKTGSSALKRASNQTLRHEPLPARTLPSTEKLKKERPVPVFHDVTFIPPSDGSEKPAPPRFRTSAADPSDKFTNDERVFFIHWLRWRLHRGPLPDKEELFEELEAEVRPDAIPLRQASS